MQAGIPGCCHGERPPPVLATSLQGFARVLSGQRAECEDWVHDCELWIAAADSEEEVGLVESREPASGRGPAVTTERLRSPAMISETVVGCGGFPGIFFLSLAVSVGNPTISGCRVVREP